MSSKNKIEVDEPTKQIYFNTFMSKIVFNAEHLDLITNERNKFN